MSRNCHDLRISCGWEKQLFVLPRPFLHLMDIPLDTCQRKGNLRAIGFNGEGGNGKKKLPKIGHCCLLNRASQHVKSLHVSLQLLHPLLFGSENSEILQRQFTTSLKKWKWGNADVLPWALPVYFKRSLIAFFKKNGFLCFLQKKAVCLLNVCLDERGQMETIKGGSVLHIPLTQMSSNGASLWP